MDNGIMYVVGEVQGGRRRGKGRGPADLVVQPEVEAAALGTKHGGSGTPPLRGAYQRNLLGQTQARQIGYHRLAGLITHIAVRRVVDVDRVQ